MNGPECEWTKISARYAPARTNVEYCIRGLGVACGHIYRKVSGQSAVLLMAGARDREAVVDFNVLGVLSIDIFVVIVENMPLA